MDSRTKSLCDFLNAAHSVYHAQAYLAETLENAGYTRLYEQDEWALAPGGKYFLTALPSWRSGCRREAPRASS
jgi:aspartyl aminopeptidase